MDQEAIFLGEWIPPLPAGWSVFCCFQFRLPYFFFVTHSIVQTASDVWSLNEFLKALFKVSVGSCLFQASGKSNTLGRGYSIDKEYPRFADDVSGRRPEVMETSTDGNPFLFASYISPGHHNSSVRKSSI
jgi:hypothetical protein